MGRFWDKTCLLLLWMVLGTLAQGTFYKNNYYSSLLQPPSRFYHKSNAYLPPLTYSSDLQSQESKGREVISRYSKKKSYRPFSAEEEDFSGERYTSAEYSNESPNYDSHENDSRELTIGTRIRVQHPITIPKKPPSTSHPKHGKYTSISPFKSSSYNDAHFESESFPPKPLTKKHPSKYTEVFDPDPFHLVPPPKAPVAAASHSFSHSYNVYEPEHEDFELPSGVKAGLRDNFKGVASKKQITKYLEDQQKLLDEALKLQILNNSKYKELLASNEHYDDDLTSVHDSPPPGYRQNIHDGPPFQPNRARRRPKSTEHKRPPRGKFNNHRPKRKFRKPVVISH